MDNNESDVRNNKPVIQEIKHGVIIVATGAQESIPKEYAYAKDNRVMTLLEFEKWLSLEESEIKNQSPKSVVMIQCVGSREDDHSYCSRVCCTGAIKNELKLKEKHPEADVFILYRDVRTYGTKEKYYREARDKGVIFGKLREEIGDILRGSVRIRAWNYILISFSLQKKGACNGTDDEPPNKGISPCP